jgi:hypothetical protein
VDRERAVLRRRVVLVERVDPLLDADAGRIGHVAVGDEPLAIVYEAVSTSIAKVETWSSAGSVVGLLPGSWNVVSW